MVEIVNSIFNDFPFLVEILFPIPEQFLSVENGVKGEIRWVRTNDKKHALLDLQKNKTEN